MTDLFHEPPILAGLDLGKLEMRNKATSLRATSESTAVRRDPDLYKKSSLGAAKSIKAGAPPHGAWLYLGQDMTICHTQMT